MSEVDALQDVEDIVIIHYSIKYCMPVIKSESAIVPSAHQPALFFTQFGTPAASALVATVAKSNKLVITVKTIFNKKKYA